METSFSFLFPSWALWKLGTWTHKRRSSQTTWCPCTMWIASCSICCSCSGREGPSHPFRQAGGFCMLVLGCPSGTPREAPEPQQSSIVVAPKWWQSMRPTQPLMGWVLSQEGAGSSLPSCIKLEAFKLLSCHPSQVCIISFLLLSANLSLAVLVVPVALLLLLALVFYFLSVLGAACFLSGFIQI